MKYKRIKLKNKRSQGVFEMSFSTIFSVILIVFFIVVAFIAIKFFLGWQKKMQIGLFFDDLQNNVNEALNSNSATLPKNYNLPSGIEDVCIIDLKNPTRNANTLEQDIYQQVLNQGNIQNFNNNVYLYSPKADYGLNWKTIKNINMTAKNPTCVAVTNGILSLKLERKETGYSVYVSAK